ncbi:MAG: ATP-binding protein [Prevotellaceae bacterium]|jgi:AAA15 family ATPase/GTPase|nr:ATP-binding protein [Prevotellaceae bacterium]
MAISGIRIKDFFVFKGEFTARFCSGVNIFTGGNGTGKTTLLRAIAIEHKNKHVFIPAGDMLEHTELYPMDRQYRLTYNDSEIEIIGSATLPVTNEITPNAAKTLDRIKSVIGGEAVYENGAFLIVKSDGAKIPFVLEAKGFRKFGLLWKLLRNGLLESESVLFWDEPENSLNPELIPVLVDILLELSRNGVQIFIATHSEIFASYFSVNQQKCDSVMFYSLYKDERGEIKADANERFDLLEQNKLMEVPVKLYEKQIEKGFGNG